MKRRMLLTAAAFSLMTVPALALATFEKSELVIESGGQAHKFVIEMARTPEQQQQGLMFRNKMEPNAGMLFVYKSAQPIAMWMYQTNIPLDMLFIAADGRIVNIHERAVPHSTTTIESAGPCVAVLELNGGTAARLKLKAGDRVKHPEIGK
jgi:uncharacterized protein